jgi:nucleoid-associated protein YgaU
MTRETRIGLLVGLVFIFAFGLILGELTNDAEAPPVQAASLRDVDYLAREMEGSLDTHEARASGIGAPSSRRTPPGRRHRDDRETASTRRTARRSETRRTSAAGTRRRVDPRTTTRRYRTMRGDTLTKIARKAYGPDNGKLYRVIYRANRDKLPSVDVVPVGVVLEIPPMPR